LQHTTGVNSAAFSPDGKKLASAEWDKAIVFWDVATGKRIDQLKGPWMQVMSVAYSPDNKALVTTMWDGIVRVWNIAARREVFKLESREDLAQAVAFAPQGRYLASGDKDGAVRLWELASGRECGRFTGHEGCICSVAFSPDGRRLTSGSGDHTVLIWDLTGRNGKPAPASRLEPEDLEQLWSDLAGEDATRAYRSGRLLASEPEKTVELLVRRLQEPLRSGVPLRVQDAANYPGLAVEEVTERPASSAELTKQREKRLGLVFYENLRIVRVATVLEWIGTDEAKEMSREIAERVQQAQVVLDRELGRLP
jgi:hypothetical protein